MKRPSTVKVYGLEIKVLYPDEQAFDENGALILGEFNPQTMSIKVYDKISPDKTLRHERMHAALDMSGLTHLLTPDLEEALCACVENAFFGIYQ